MRLFGKDIYGFLAKDLILREREAGHSVEYLQEGFFVEVQEALFRGATEEDLAGFNGLLPSFAAVYH